VRGASRASFAELSERLTAQNITDAASATKLADELFAVVGLLGSEHALRRALSDPGKPAREKRAIASALLHGKVTPFTEELVVAAVESRWAITGDMVDAIEQLAIEAMTIAADHTDTLDEVEDELFRFGRVVEAQPDLRAVLGDASLPADGKQRMLRTLLEGKVTSVTFSLISQMVAHPRGRRLGVALERAANIAAQRRQQLIAVARAATELPADQRRRLAQALARTYGRRVHLNVVIDPSVLGGISVQIGDELIDGTVASRLAEVRRGLAG
jgi:F-type H+-transporting ATPase subunit delta